MRPREHPHPSYSHSHELIFSQCFEKVLALHLVGGQSQDTQYKVIAAGNFCCQDAFSTFFLA